MSAPTLRLQAPASRLAAVLLLASGSTTTLPAASPPAARATSRPAAPSASARAAPAVSSRVTPAASPPATSGAEPAYSLVSIRIPGRAAPVPAALRLRREAGRNLLDVRFLESGLPREESLPLLPAVPADGETAPLARDVLEARGRGQALRFRLDPANPGDLRVAQGGGSGEGPSWMAVEPLGQGEPARAAFESGSLPAGLRVEPSSQPIAGSRPESPPAEPGLLFWVPGEPDDPRRAATARSAPAAVDADAAVAGMAGEFSADIWQRDGQDGAPAQRAGRVRVRLHRGQSPGSLACDIEREGGGGASFLRGLPLEPTPTIGLGGRVYHAIGPDGTLHRLEIEDGRVRGYSSERGALRLVAQPGR